MPGADVPTIDERYANGHISEVKVGESLEEPPTGQRLPSTPEASKPAASPETQVGAEQDQQAKVDKAEEVEKLSASLARGHEQMVREVGKKVITDSASIKDKNTFQTACHEDFDLDSSRAICKELNIDSMMQITDWSDAHRRIAAARGL